MSCRADNFVNQQVAILVNSSYQDSLFMEGKREVSDKSTKAFEDYPVTASTADDPHHACRLPRN
jgi:hypothetical protein